MLLSVAQVTTYDELLLDLATWVLAACGLWAVLMVAAALAETLSRGRVRVTSWVATPPAVRRALFAGLGLLLAGGMPGPVSAAVTFDPARRPEPLGSSGSSWLPVPQRQPGGTRALASVVVRPGDTLWDIAAARLLPRADDAHVLAAVDRWHARNRRLIGPDRDLIRPGQRLAPPSRGLRPHRSPEEHP